jgi:ER membrane protein complex subunit 4
MNAIMMYMSGNSLQIFSIMMVFMLFKGPIQGLMNTNAAFVKFESDTTRGRLLGVKVVYVLMQFALLALGVWKVNAMGLLPYVFFLFLLQCTSSALKWRNGSGLQTASMGSTDSVNFNRTTRSDWLAWESERQPLERAYFAFG